MDNSITYLRIEHYSGHPEVAKAAEHLVEAIAETKQFLKGRDNWLRDSKKLIASLWVRSDDQLRFSTKKDFPVFGKAAISVRPIDGINPS